MKELKDGVYVSVASCGKGHGALFHLVFELLDWILSFHLPLIAPVLLSGGE